MFADQVHNHILNMGGERGKRTIIYCKVLNLNYLQINIYINFINMHTFTLNRMHNYAAHGSANDFCLITFS